MTKLIRIIPVLLLFSACDAGIFSSENDDLRLELEIKSEEINTLRDIEAELTATNISDDELVYGFSSSCQHGYTIKQDSTVLFDSREKTACATVLTELKLEPQESKKYSISLASAESGDTLESGTYILEAFLLHDQSPVTEAVFTVE